MKKVFGKLVATAFIAGIFVCCTSCDREFGNGILVTLETPVSEFEKINCEELGSATVRYYYSEDYQVFVTFDENLQKYTDIYTTGNTLNIRLSSKNIYRYRELLIDVYCPYLTGVTVANAVDFEGADKITAPSFNANVSDAGNIEGEFECDNFIARVSDAGEMTAVGTATNAYIYVFDSGDFKGKEFMIKNADIRIRDAGDADVWVTDSLKATIYDSGDLKYWGDPEIDANVNDAGSIKKM